MAHYQGEEFTGRHADLKKFILEVSEQGGYVKMTSSHTARIELLPERKAPKKKAPPKQTEEELVLKPAVTPWAFNKQSEG